MIPFCHHGLIGHTGFVGSSLKKQHHFDFCFRSNDIHTLVNQDFDLLVCAGAPAKKWLANQQPEIDRASITKLIHALSSVRTKRFILISTVDVFSDPTDVDESSSVETNGLHPYGLHRRELEQFVERQFSSALIVRLPGLVGPGLRKNIVFDIHHQNDVFKVDSRGVFQFYPMINLWTDLQAAMSLGINLLHLTAEPISVSEVSADGFGIPFENHVAECPPSYDFQTQYASQLGGVGRYTYSKRETLQAVRAYAQTEPKPSPGSGDKS
jgi:hypothetical protein